MTDMVIKAASTEIMFAAFTALGLLGPDGQLHTSGRFEGGTNWEMAFPDKVWDRDTNLGTEEEPQYNDLPGSYVYLRWNGGQDQNPFWQAVEPFNLEVWWSNDPANPGTNAVLPEWFQRVD